MLVVRIWNNRDRPNHRSANADCHPSPACNLALLNYGMNALHPLSNTCHFNRETLLKRLSQNRSQIHPRRSRITVAKPTVRLSVTNHKETSPFISTCIIKYKMCNHRMDSLLASSRPVANALTGVEPYQTTQQAILSFAKGSWL